MTKRIRVENADCNTVYRVFIHHQEKRLGEWATVRTEELHATNLLELHIHDGKRVIVEEKTVHSISVDSDGRETYSFKGDKSV